MNPKRVLIFSLTYIPFVGGAEVAVKAITDRIDPSDTTFDLITLRVDSNLPLVERVGNVTVYRVGPARKALPLARLGAFPWYITKILYVPLALLKARSLSRQIPYDAYWSIMTNMVFPVALLKKFFNDKTPHIITLQDGDTAEHILHRGRIRMFKNLLTSSFAQAHVVHTISRFLANLARQLGAPGDSIVIPNGVDVAHFSDKRWKQDPLHLIYRFDKKPNDVFLITTSRLVEKNGVADIVGALALLPSRVKLLVVGDGPLGTALWELASSLGVERRVCFVGHVAHEDVPAYLAIADIFVRPSLSEGMGNSFVEAMAAGLPVIGTPVGGIVDFLFDPSSTRGDIAPTGIMCRPQDPQSVAGAVERLINDPKLVRLLVKNAREMVRAVYEWDSIAQRMRTEVFGRAFER